MESDSIWEAVWDALVDGPAVAAAADLVGADLEDNAEEEEEEEGGGSLRRRFIAGSGVTLVEPFPAEAEALEEDDVDVIAEAS